MDSLARFLSPSGRLAPKQFAIGVVIVYVLLVLSQVLLARPITLRAGVAPYALAQAAITWAWYVLHRRRLADAGRASGAALGIAILYGLSVLLFMLLIELVIGTGAVGPPSGENDTGGRLAAMLIVFFLLAMFTGDPATGVFFYVALFIMVLIYLPLLVALGFSIWAGTRPSAEPAPP